ncbi:MAG: AarF/ABC1/UbiB kinase family protein [Bacteroidota bacterium]
MGLISFFEEKYKHVRRYNQIISVLLKYGFEDLVSYMEEKKRFAFVKKLLPKSTLNQSIQLTKWEKMRMVCEELGPTYVKFGQLLSNRGDLLPAELIKELEKLQDGVPPVPGNVAAQVVEQELKKKAEDIFEWFQPEAFASASMAQVHRATLKTGEQIVLKIQRPGIREVIEQDIKVMLYLAEIFRKRIPSLKSFDPVGLVKNFEEGIFKELDFINESINLQRFYNNFTEDDTNNGSIHSPKVYREYSTSKVLAMEFVQGVKINNLQKLEAAGLDKSLVAKRLAISYFKQIFKYGFFHGDPHPGNLLVLEGNVVCFLDYGMMGSIMKKDIQQIGFLFISVKNKDVRKIIRAIQMLSDNPVIRNYRALETDLNEFVQNYSVQESMKENEISTILLQLKDVIVKHKLKVPTHFFMLARSIVSIEGVIHQLDPNLNLTKLMQPYLLRTIANQYSPIKFTKGILSSIYEMGTYMEEFPRDLKNAIRKINTGEIKVDLRHKGIDPLVHTVHRVTKQLISAILIASLIIGSSLLLVYKVPPLWGNSSGLGVFGLIIAGLLAIGLINNLRRGDHDDWSGWEENQ